MLAHATRTCHSACHTACQRADGTYRACIGRLESELREFAEMPADPMEKSSASPLAGAPASGAHTPDKPRSASEHRKSSKPIMEKRRRARINESLGQLKSLILEALKKDSSRHSKLEKADILEMTVKHLRNLQRMQITALTSDTAVLSKYRAGFNECVNEVTRFLSTCEGVNAEVRSRLLGHLSGCLGQMCTAVSFPQAAPATVVPCKLSPAEPTSPKVYGGFQLLPAPDGHFAFLIPSPAFSPAVPVYASQAVQGITTFSAQSSSPVSRSPGLEGPESVWRPW